MSIILIENYRGFDIEFNTANEKFQCIITDDAVKESVSFAATKKFIDDYRKTNQDFNPFWIESSPDSAFVKKGKLRVVGIRKDGRFVAEDANGNKIQIPDYNLNDYILVKPENQDLINRLDKLNEAAKIQRDKDAFERDKIIKSMNIVTLKDYRKQIN